MSEMQLTVRPQDATILTFDEIMTIGPILAESGYFTDAAKANQAIVKVLAGREIGIGPVASMTGIHVIKGKPAVGANIMAAAVKSNPKYDYRVRSMDNTVCSIEFFERGQSLGLSTFTIEDARKAGTQNLDKFARNMLFARAISNGVRWYCPDTFSSAVGLYTPEELGAQVDEDGDVIEAVATIIKDEPPTDKKPTNGDQKPAPQAGQQASRPLAAESIRSACRKKAQWFDGDDGPNTHRNVAMEPTSDKQVQLVATLLGKSTPNLDAEMQDHARHDVLGYLFGVTSTHELMKAEASAIIDWLKAADSWEPGPYATAEVAAILSTVVREAGQLEMPLAADAPF